MFKYGDCFQNTKRDDDPIKVLVVDHKKDLLAYVAEVLHSFAFQVTCIDHSGAALRLLSEKKNEFDLLLIDRNMSDVDVHTFLKLTMNMNVLSIVMAEQEDDSFLSEAIKSGAHLVLKRPLTIDAVRIIRQDAIRERILRHGKRKSNNMILKTERHEEQVSILENGFRNSRSHAKKRYESYESDDGYGDDYDYCNMKKKICVEWTQELHEKFLNAVNQLGEGRCYPKKILDLMAVPGLTRMQVASHLQKCRKEKWRSNEKQTPSWNQTPPGNNLFPQSVNERKFGCMPSLRIQQNDQEESGSTLIGINLSINGWQTEVNRMKNQTYKSSSHRIEHAQFPFGSGLGSTEDGGYGTRITKTTNNYFQQEINGVRGGGGGDARQGLDQHTFSLIQRQASDEFPDFLKDLDGNGPTDHI